MDYEKDTLKIQDPRDPDNADAKIEVEVEYAKPATFADCAVWAGSEDNARDFFINAAHAKATNTGKLKELASLDKNSTEVQIVAACKRLADYIRNYVPTVGRTGASAVKFVDALKNAAAEKETFTKADLAELAKQFGMTI